METIDTQDGQDIRGFVESRLKAFLDSYSILNVGHITQFVDPVNRQLGISDALAIFAEHPELTSLPVEGDTGVIGIVHKTQLMGKKSAITAMTNPPVERFMDASGFFVDASENCEKAMTRVLARGGAALYDDFMIYERGRYFGIGTFSELSRAIAAIRALDLAKAKAMQEHLMARNRAESSGVKYSSMVRMAHEIGGDLLMTMDLRDGLSMLACFDVCGKGTAAAILTGAISAFFSTLKTGGALASLQPPALVAALNRMLMDQTTEEGFVAAALAFVDSSKREAVFYNCGFQPIYVFYADPETGKPKARMVNSNLWPMGINEYAGVRGAAVPLHYKFRFFMYSDGLTDALDGRGNRFGEEGLKTFLLPRSQKPAAQILEELTAELDAFVGEAPQADDITVLVAEVP
jgi:serine phosphatase RsbU (regulator of sigma subunit)